MGPYPCSAIHVQNYTLPSAVHRKAWLSNDFRPYISSQATQSSVGKIFRAISVCAMLNVGVKLGSLSRYAHLCLVNMVL